MNKGGRYLALRCDVLVGACIREQTDHLLAPLLRCDEQGSGTTLHWVACLLSDAGADKDIAMQGGATPLFIASQQGRTPLLVASQSGHL